MVFIPGALVTALQRSCTSGLQQQRRPEPGPVSAVLVRWSPPAVLVRWQYAAAAEEPLHHFRVLYQAAHDRRGSSSGVAVASGDQRSVLLERLEPETEYLVRVLARPDPTRANDTDDAPVGLVRFVSPGAANGSSSSSGGGGSLAAARPVVRDEEIVIVVLVLSVWLAVILLFFNKWGKIRMLEPYQPQYQEPESPPVLQVKGSSVLERELRRFSSNVNGGGSAAARLQRLRHNSVFVGSQILVPMSRRVKSCEDIKSMVLHIDRLPPPGTQSTAL
ncbi:uncharacterized protein LOC144175190 [Haemaphysalis longicornis]